MARLSCYSGFNTLSRLIKFAVAPIGGEAARDHLPRDLAAGSVCDAGDMSNLLGHFWGDFARNFYKRFPRRFSGSSHVLVYLLPISWGFAMNFCACIPMFYG